VLNGANQNRQKSASQCNSLEMSHLVPETGRDVGGAEPGIAKLHFQLDPPAQQFRARRIVSLETFPDARR